MRKYILLLLFAVSTLANAQVVKKVTVGDKTIEIYRLDDNQRSKLGTLKYAKDKKKNAQYMEEVSDSYSKLEKNLNLLSRNIDLCNDKILNDTYSFLRIIDYRLGSDAPNNKELLAEFNCYAKYYSESKGR
ncbi:MULTISPECIES: hypothetical protein [unclassified Dysgonomonas]|uniref:hypothetical protein n=1 Tax=unclassified Dysgonomonas TaxID=2630389 RepID=UPI0013EDFAB7|nr:MULTISPECIES: hypothetical protein [unclassified Dysgonomonas]